MRTNQGTCINQRPVVKRGDRVEAGRCWPIARPPRRASWPWARTSCCAFMSWEGYNFEDAIIVSNRLVGEDKFTSIHIDKHEVEARDTKLGPEEITRDIPNVGEESLRELDEDGIIRIGAEVGPATSWWAKSPPRARPSSPPRKSCCAPSSAKRPARSKTPRCACLTASGARSSTSRIFNRERRRRPARRRQPVGAGLGRPEAQDLGRRQAGRAARQQGRHLHASCPRKTCPSCPTARR